MLLELARGFRELAFPSICLGCEAVVPGSSEHFCRACISALTTDPHTTCPRCCSNVGEFADTENGCPNCRNDRFHFECAFRLGQYEGLLAMRSCA